MAAQPCEHFYVHIRLGLGYKEGNLSCCHYKPKVTLNIPPFPITKGREFQDFLWKKATYPPHLH